MSFKEAISINITVLKPINSDTVIKHLKMLKLAPKLQHEYSTDLGKFWILKQVLGPTNPINLNMIWPTTTYILVKKILGLTKSDRVLVFLNWFYRG